jgi:4-hydroxybenzoate polyprenyltransferase
MSDSQANNAALETTTGTDAVAPPFVPPTRARLRWLRLTRRAREYAQLMRLHRPIGIGLLLWPTLWAVWIAADGMPSGKILFLFVLGTVVMRSAGCIVNDFADRDIDPHVKRTRDRPLAARRVSPREALLLFAALLTIGLLIALQLNAFALQLAFIGAGLTLTYPLLKRFFPAPQFYLGLAFGWGVPMAFAATHGEVSRVGWLLFIAALLWAVIYDTEYAMVDRDDDQRIGVQSTAIMFGDLDRLMIGVMQLLMLATLVIVGRNVGLGSGWLAGLAGLGLCFLWQQWLIRARKPAACFRAFLNNGLAGFLVLLGLLADRWLDA